MDYSKNQKGFVKFLVLVIIIVAAFALIHVVKKPQSPCAKNTGQICSLTPSEKTVGKPSGSLRDLPINEKMNRAENYLKQYEKDLNAFFPKLEEKDLSPQELQKYMKQYNSIVQGYTGKINGLQLMCPVSAQVSSSSQYRRYQSWTKEFQAKDMKVMNEASQRVQKILKKAGFTAK